MSLSRGSCTLRAAVSKLNSFGKIFEGLPSNSSLVSCRQISSQEVFERELEHGYETHRFQPLENGINRSSGVFVWDTEGRRYYDFVSSDSMVNHGHCHPRIFKAMVEQAAKLTYSSQPFYSDVTGEFEEHVTQLFKYDKWLPTVTEMAGVKAACKLAKNWGHAVKEIESSKLKIVLAEGSSWGPYRRPINSNVNPPITGNFELIPYDDLTAADEALADPSVCAFVAEPIQSEAGVLVPKDGYLKGVRELCTKHNVLWIADEVQTGLGRTGMRLAVDHEQVKPDLLILGRALSGGMYPISGILANDSIMSLELPHDDESWSRGVDPLGYRIALEALQVLEEEKLAENASKFGNILREELEKLLKQSIKSVRGKGLLNAVVLDDSIDATNVCCQLKDEGLLAKPIDDHTIRLAPPLVITEDQIYECIDIIKSVLLASDPEGGSLFVEACYESAFLATLKPQTPIL
ncbi:hypothetical protein QAD02_023590 [Eretmocerus hayati]|uniref:Uncharacterized protein n=1 Tax=Eretmocerus hayati TaxID=131215 RepID=A0ACC2PXY6_9HYME|nr:hypothetical protein QAD02_023590 [Eretmocerus hayati]